MILVVADTTPLRYLVEIGYEHLLLRLFKKVWIPLAVATELQRERTPGMVRNCAEQLLSGLMYGKSSPVLTSTRTGEPGSRRVGGDPACQGDQG